MRHDRSRMTMKELIAEAERRQIGGAEWMDRASLVRALDESETEKAGPLARARRFLGQVTGLDRVVKVVRGAIDPSRPEPVTLVPLPGTSFRVLRRTSARKFDPDERLSGSNFRADVLVTERTQAVVREVVAPAPIASPVSVVESVGESASESVSENESVETVAAATTPATSELLAGDPSFGGMRVVTREGRTWLVWRAPASRLAAIGRGSEITLRTVSIGCAIGEPGAEVVVETADEPGLGLEGVRALPDVRRGQCVAAIGVGRGDGFVAIAHARVA